MGHAYPEKDVDVAAKLIQKLGAAEDDYVKAKADYDSASEHFDGIKAKTEVRSAYYDILTDIAAEVGAELDPHDTGSLKELESKIAEAKSRLDTKRVESDRLKALAEKLSSNAPDLFALAAEKAKSAPATPSPAPAQPEPPAEPPKKREPVDRNPAKLKEVFELDRLKANRQLKKRGNTFPKIVFDAFNIIQLVKRYHVDPFKSLDQARDILVCDLDFLSGELGIPVAVEFDTAYATDEAVANALSIHANSARTSPDKSASDRQILRLLEEAQLERRPVVLVTNDVPLSREGAALSAIHLTLSEVFKDA